MSYILDALQKAESDRKLGSIPGIHAQQVGSNISSERTVAWRKSVLWTIAAALVTTIAIILWLTLGQAPAPVTTAMQTPLPVQKNIPESPNVRSAAPDPAEKLIPEIASEPMKLKVDPMLDTRSANRKSGKPAKTVKKSVAAIVAVPSVASASAATLPTLLELPEKIRQEIPPLAIGGYIYSDIQADRQLLVNKKLLREGDDIAPGLRLEKMTSNAAVLSYKGYRYRITY